ncbi:MAG: hypothetical protein HRU18_26030 [Pseudoalteromonas sp.]|uniref:hypothetical protein n=1 Tax=Pseudoalteromonas sp. TaxID=53249 RepID=UPI001D7D2B15|nr:hypothetical protein [Pseudoalteromonas sp.]NRA81673.1 hypothetical protein [Pseudoalteromonas sp.]
MRYLFELPKNEHVRRAVVGQLKELGYEFMSGWPEKAYIKSKVWPFLKAKARAKCNVLMGCSNEDGESFEVVFANELLSNPDKYRFKEEFKSAADGTKHFQEYNHGHVNHLNHVMTKQNQVRLVDYHLRQNQICYDYRGGDLVSVWTKGNGYNPTYVYTSLEELEDAVKVLKNLRDMS